MQISKCLLIVGVAVCAMSLRADDEAQIKARAALEQKLHAVQSPTPAAAPAAPVAEPAKTPVPEPAPAAAQPAVAAAHTTPQLPITNKEAQAKAREALDAKMRELTESNSPVAVQPLAAPAQPVPPTAPAPTTVPPPVVANAPEPATTPPPAAIPQPAAAPLPGKPAAADPAAIAKARAEMQKTLATVPTEPAQEVPVRYGMVPPPKPPAVSTPFPKLEGPPLPISADKQQQLQNLLQKYKADQITPEQYHAERAKILAN